MEKWKIKVKNAAAAAKSHQLCLTLCDPIDGSPQGSSIPGILLARTLEWVAISFSNVWKWSRSVVSNPQRPHGLQPSRLLRQWDFPGKSTGVGCHCLLRRWRTAKLKFPVYAVVQLVSRVWFFVIPMDCSMLGPSLSPGVCSNSCPLILWCHPIISPSVIPLYNNCKSKSTKLKIKGWRKMKVE